MSLLRRDKTRIEEVSDYKIYPMADNKTYYKQVWNLNTIKDI